MIPYVIPTGSSLTPGTGLEIWLEASDLNGTFNAGTVWTDRIQSKGMKANTFDFSPGLPTASANYLTFAGNAELTNTVNNLVVFCGNNSLYKAIVLVVRPTAGHTAANQCYVGPGDGTDTAFAYLTGPKFTWNNGFTLDAHLQDNANWQDLIIQQTNLSNTQIAFNCYSNNVLSFATSQNSANLQKTLTQIGATAAHPLFGDLAAVRVYTNANVPPLSAADMTSIHNFYTNKLSYAP